MLNRPSSRRRTKGYEDIQLNLVPILDAMVTLIGFMLFTMSFLTLVAVESPAPITTPQEVAEKLKEKPLQLTLSIRENDVEVWSPFGKIANKTIPHSAPGTPDVRAIHEALIPIKQQFPAETKIVLVPHARVNYDILVLVMDGVRVLEKTDPPIFVKNATTGNDEPLKSLFPEVVFGNLLGDS